MSDCSCQACLSGVGACGCCEGVDTVTPRAIYNRPGLSRLAVRIGTHADFMESMQARLSTHALADGTRPLLALRTRDRADPSIALLDAFAVTGDVLTFYQERIANEGYLGTATQDRSVRELARLIGYEPSPGVSAGTYLAFTLDSDPETPVTIAAGTGAQSLPGQNELPQIFETSRDLVARARWNKLGLRLTEPERGASIDPSGRYTDIFLDGTETGLKPGDALLFQWGEARPIPVRVLDVAPDPDAKLTAVTVEAWIRGTYVGPPENAPQPTLALLRDDLTDADRAVLSQLREDAPGGTIAPDLVRSLERFELAQPAERPALRLELNREILAARTRIGGLPQPTLRPWLDQLELRFPEPAAPVAARAAMTAAPAAAAPVTASRGDGEDDNRPSWIEALAVPASAPPRSSEQLARSTGTSFAKGSDAAYRTLGVALPAVRERIGAALSGTRDGAPALDFRVYAFRIRTGVFGRTFPKRRRTTRDSDGTDFETIEIGEWPILYFGGRENVLSYERPEVINLEAVQDGIVPDSWVMVDMRGIDRPDPADEWLVDRTEELLLTRVDRVDPKVARAVYGGSGDSTAIYLGLKSKWLQANDDMSNRFTDQEIIDRDFQLIRRTVVYARPELLPLAPRPLAADFCVHPVPGKPLPWVELDGAYSGLEPGRYVAISGERADIGGVEGVRASEVAMIAEAIHGVRSVDGEPVTPGDYDAQIGDIVHTFLRFANPLSYCYRRPTVALQANVVKATHGETVRETLGNGDAAAARQRFALKRFPLTYTPAPNADGIANSLEVYVDDIRWRAAPSLVNTGPHERVYTVRNDAGGKATVIFPDGRDGARPPTGTQNIRAVYRAGIGRPGNLGPARLEQLVTRPLGLRGVTNPVAATGGADAEPREQTRRNAPISTMALDRLVSVGDHEDFACTFAGIARATAQVMASGSRRILHLTIAAEDDAPLDPQGDLILNLRGAFRLLGDPDLPVVVAPRELRLLIISAKVRIDADRVWDVVAQAIRARLIERFGFEARELAQGLAPSVVVAAIQSVPGVAWVDLDTFGGVPTMRGPASQRLVATPDQIAQAVAKVTTAGVARWVPAWSARPGKESWPPALLPAELLMLSPDVPATLVLNQIK